MCCKRMQQRRLTTEADVITNHGSVLMWQALQGAQALQADAAEASSRAAKRAQAMEAEHSARGARATAALSALQARPASVSINRTTIHTRIADANIVMVHSKWIKRSQLYEEGLSGHTCKEDCRVTRAMRFLVSDRRRGLVWIGSYHVIMYCIASVYVTLFRCHMPCADQVRETARPGAAKQL